MKISKEGENIPSMKRRSETHDYHTKRFYMVRRAHPDYFRVRFGVEVAGLSYAAKGNRILLQKPEKVRVQLSRSLTDEQMADKVAEYLAIARTRKGAVIVSPAISKGEQAVMRAALNEHLP